MKILALLVRRFRFLNLPGAILMMLLQRTPVVNFIAATEELVVASPAGTLLKSVVSALGVLGAVNTLVGASALTVSSGTSTGITVASGAAMSVSFSLPGSDSRQDPTAKWTLGIASGSSFPPGLNFSGLTAAGTANVVHPQLSGTPTTAGTYNITLQAFSADGQFSSPTYPYAVTVTGGTTATAPAITLQPASQTVAPGSSVTFNAGASGTPAPTFQWQKNSANIAGATSASFSIASLSAGDAGNYTFIATNSAGSATSNPATLTVSAATSAPTFSTQPLSQSVAPGAGVSFTVAATGSPTPTFQWQKGGANIAGATNATFTIASVATGDAGSYTAIATNSAGSTTSTPATLTVSAVSSPPVITTQPLSQSVTAGSSATFTTVATGSPAPTFKWQKNGADITGATSASYLIGSATAGDAGSYDVIVTNSAGTVTSNIVSLTVAASQLASQTVTAGHGTTFSAANATGAIQWQVSTDGGTSWSNVSNNSTYSGATTSTLTLTNAPAALNGAKYRYVATSTSGVSTSNAVGLTVAQAFLPFPTAITADSVGNLYVTDSNADTIQKINSAGQISLLAGTTGTAGTTDGVGAAARFNQPAGIALIASGIVYVADTSNATVRRIASDGTVTTLAGAAANRGNGDGTGTAAMFSLPTGIAVDASGTLYVADAMNDTIRKVTSTGAVTTFAGSAGVTGSADGNGAAARFNFPTGIIVDGNGNIYVSDTTNNTIRKITSAGDVSTIAGVQGVSGAQDGTGGGALFNHPGGLAVDAAGNLYLADTGNSTIRKITGAGVVTTLAGLPGIAGLQDGTGSSAFLNQPQALVVGTGGNLYVADTGNAMIRKIDANGTVTTVTLTSAATPTPTPTPAPTPTPTPAPTPAPSSGGGGGGAMNDWFIGALSLMCLSRFYLKRKIW